MSMLNFNLAQVVVLRPTRGLEFAESALSIQLSLSEAVLKEYVDIESGLRPTYRSWGRAIPDSFNHLAKLFIDQTKCDYAWIVEEDIIVPHDALEALLALDVDVAAINYNLKTGGPNRDSELRSKDGELYTLSTGCMLIRRRVFEALPYPWFRTDRAPGLVHPGSSTDKKFFDLIPNTSDYGGHDGYFTFTAMRAGFSVRSVPNMRCEHLQLDALGAAASNDGCHAISRVS